MVIEIREKLVSLRAGNGLTQEEVAHHLGITKAAVSKWECGQSLPDITLLPDIARLYSITVDELLGCAQVLDEEAVNEVYQRALALLGEDYAAGCQHVGAQAREHWGSPELLRLLGAALFAQIPVLPGFDGESLEGQSLECARETERIVRRTIELSPGGEVSAIELPALARILMWTGRRSEAEELLNERVRKEPGLEASLLAQLNVETGRRDAGIAVLQQALLVSLLETQATMASMAPLVDDGRLSDLIRLAESLQMNGELTVLFPTLMPTLYLQQAKHRIGEADAEGALEALGLFAEALDKACAVMSSPVNPALFDKVQDMMWAEEDDAVTEARRSSVSELRAAYAASLSTDDIWTPLRGNRRFAAIVGRVSGNPEER